MQLILDNIIEVRWCNLVNKITYKFDISKESKQFLDHGLELYNFSKNK